MVYSDDDCQKSVEKKYRGQLPEVEIWKYDEMKFIPDPPNPEHPDWNGGSFDAPHVKLPGFEVEWDRPARAVRC